MPQRSPQWRQDFRDNCRIADQGFRYALIIILKAKPQTTPLKLACAFGTVYIVWGSTYLAIHYAIETIPPFLMAGARFLTAGLILYVILRMSGVEKPARGHWKSAGIVGAFLLLGGNGAVVLAQQTVPSGITALILGITPLWMVVLGWLWLRDQKPSLRIFTGLFLGIAGLLFLIKPAPGAHSLHLPGVLMLIFATLSWTLGSLSVRKLKLPSSPFMASALQMIAGGVLMFGAAILCGEPGRFDITNISWRSLAGYAYLTLIGSLIGFSAYIYVLKHSTPAMASTYAYVNPIVAVFLGWAIASEPVTARTLIAAAIIIAAVILITLPSFTETESELESVDAG